MIKEINLPIHEIAQEIEQGGILFNVTYVEFESPDCVRIDYGVGGQLSVWLYRNGGTDSSGMHKNKEALKYFRSKGFKI